MILALILIGSLDGYVGTLEGRPPFILPDNIQSYHRRLDHFSSESPTKTLIRIGNSRSSGLVGHILSKRLLGTDTDELFSITMGGAMPVTHNIVMDSLDYSCVQVGDTVLYCLTPMDLNRYNLCYRRTILAFFSWKEFFKELVRHGRWDDITFFLSNDSLNIVKFRNDIRNLIARKLFSFFQDSQIEGIGQVKEDLPITKVDRSRLDPKLYEQNLRQYENDYFWSYTIDDYQVDAVLDLIGKVHSREANTVLLLIPLSKELREILGKENLDRFIEVARGIAKDTDIPLLDYITGYTGEEYPCFDASHYTIDARTEFTRNVAEDLKQISAERGFPRLDVDIDPKHFTLRIDREWIGPGGQVIFTLDAGMDNRWRRYKLLGSSSGREPGTDFPTEQVVVLPINSDDMTGFIENDPDNEVYLNFTGTLDDEGKAMAVMRLPPKLPEQFKGKILDFAFSLDIPPSYVSNAVTVMVEDH